MSVLIRLTAFSLVAALGIIIQPAAATSPLLNEESSSSSSSYSPLLKGGWGGSSSSYSPLLKGGWGGSSSSYSPLLKGGWGGSSLLAQTTNASELLQQGLNLYQAENFSEAVKVLQSAADAFQTQKSPLTQALALNYVALAYQQLGQLPEASKAIADTLTLLQSNKSDSKEYLSSLARAFNTIGQLQLKLGQSEKALNSWEQATKAYTKIDDTPGIIGSQINQAQALQALGFYRRSLITLIQVNQTLQKQPDSPLKATGLLSLGNGLRAIGDLDKKPLSPSLQTIPETPNPSATSEIVVATRGSKKPPATPATPTAQKPPETPNIESLGSRQVLEQALVVAQNVQAPEIVAQVQLALGNTARDQQLALGNTAHDQQNLEDEALEFYRQAATTSKSPLTQIQAQLNQLQLLIQKGQFSEVQNLVPQIQSKLATLPPTQKGIYARINFAQNLINLRQKDPAFPGGSPTTTDIAQILDTANEQAKTLSDVRSQSYALGTLGTLYEQEHLWEQARDFTQQAVVVAENIQAPDIAYRWQWQLGRILKTPDNPQNSNDGAIASYSKAVNTLKSLRNDLVAINPDVQFSFTEGVEPVYREFVGLLLRDNEPPQKNLSQARDVIESLQLSELDNFFRKACLDTKVVNIDQIDKTAAVIYPIILGDRLEVILSLPNQPKQPLRHYSTPISESKVDSVVVALDTALVPKNPAYSDPRTDFLPFAQEMYSWLIKPAEADLQKNGIKTLVFVLDGSLRNVPMAVLHDGQQYLVEKYSIALTPGLQLLPPQPLERARLKTLLGGLTEARQGFTALPNVKNELQRVDSQVKGSTLLNSQFTTANLEKSIKSSNSPVVHLATHGQFSSNAEETFILTWNNRIDVNELGALLRSRNSNQRNPIELLVLSACETARGDKRAALGLAGVAVRAGARSTLATLWPVSDEATNTVMGQFYQQYAKAKVSKAEALRSAQLSVLKDPKYQHPYFWAPYVLVGNWL